MLMSSGPQRTAIGNPEASTSSAVTLRLGDQVSRGPIGVADQSNSRTRRAISPGGSSPPSGANRSTAEAGGRPPILPEALLQQVERRRREQLHVLGPVGFA